MGGASSDASLFKFNKMKTRASKNYYNTLIESWTKVLGLEEFILRIKTDKTLSPFKDGATKEASIKASLNRIRRAKSNITRAKNLKKSLDKKTNVK
jgi:hypothetical protein